MDDKPYQRSESSRRLTEIVKRCGYSNDTVSAQTVSPMLEQTDRIKMREWALDIIG